MRGKHVENKGLAYEYRITPAHAGKTPMRFDGLRGLRDHPRACGENPVAEPHGREERGSPPRMRGKLAFRAEGDRYVRITPAHAGKTCD